MTLDPAADVTDVYAFVSYDDANLARGPQDRKVTLIMNVIPGQEPSSGPNYFSFDDNVLYQFKIDNNRDGRDDLRYEVRFKTDGATGIRVFAGQRAETFAIDLGAVFDTLNLRVETEPHIEGVRPPLPRYYIGALHPTTNALDAILKRGNECNNTPNRDNAIGHAAPPSLAGKGAGGLGQPFPCARATMICSSVSRRPGTAASSVPKSSRLRL